MSWTSILEGQSLDLRYKVDRAREKKSKILARRCLHKYFGSPINGVVPESIRASIEFVRSLADKPKGEES